MKLINARFETKKQAIQHMLDGKPLWNEKELHLEYHANSGLFTKDIFSGAAGTKSHRALDAADINNFKDWQVEEVWTPENGEWIAVKDFNGNSWSIDRFERLDGILFECNRTTWDEAQSLENFNEE